MWITTESRHEAANAAAIARIRFSVRSHEIRLLDEPHLEFDPEEEQAEGENREHIRQEECEADRRQQHEAEDRVANPAEGPGGDKRSALLFRYSDPPGYAHRRLCPCGPDDTRDAERDAGHRYFCRRLHEGIDQAKQLS